MTYTIIVVCRTIFLIAAVALDIIAPAHKKLRPKWFAPVRSGISCALLIFCTAPAVCVREIWMQPVTAALAVVTSLSALCLLVALVVPVAKTPKWARIGVRIGSLVWLGTTIALLWEGYV